MATSLRADGATRGDQAEATALVVAGAVLLVLPFVAVLDRMGEIWFWLSVLFALGGVFIGALGVRWFLTEGPALSANPAESHPACAGDPIEIPVNVRLVDARSRLYAHALRFSALGSAVVLLVVELGVLKWGVVGLFGLSFAADHILLRPQRYVLDADGLHPGGLLKRRAIEWSAVSSLFWRHYPDDAQPTFPSGERIIVERNSGDDLEYVFNRKYGGTEAAVVVRALLPVLSDRIRILSPGRTLRVDLGESRVSEALEASSEVDGQ